MIEKAKVLIVESSGPQDFYSEELDGPLTYNLTKLLSINARLVYAVDEKHFKKAVARAAKLQCNVLHVSCHGREEGISLTDDTLIDWPDFVQIFTDNRYSPKALVMSSCWGAVDEIADEFEKVRFKPDIIFGATDDRCYNEYAVAWTILYNAFSQEGVDRDVAREALRAIYVTAHKNFRYLRWHDGKKEYVQFPGDSRKYEIIEKSKGSKKKVSTVSR
ncbi:hypothetical protein [Bradyrhizobium sp. RT9a]|uniref:hypothetical protein n=1 Tax=Bradyrhizobium sp. RT9a TaxID=3156384 RepID=UPI0033929C58